jgi:hypothetical protein
MRDSQPPTPEHIVPMQDSQTRNNGSVVIRGGRRTHTLDARIENR